MQLSNELAQKRYERLRVGIKEDHEVIEVANLEKLRKEGERIFKEMHEDGKVCTFAQCILDDDEAKGNYNFKNVTERTSDELVNIFVKLTQIVRMKGVGMNFESDKGTEGYIVVCNGI